MAHSCAGGTQCLRYPVCSHLARRDRSAHILSSYRLMDYIYTAFHQAHVDGTPVLNAMWYKYPQDASTFPIDLQFFFGDSILVSPVTEENSTSVSAYFPKDIFYDFLTLKPFQGKGQTVNLQNVNFTSIPVHIRGGAVLPLREKSAMTTTSLRATDFEIVVAPDAQGQASGSLYADDGVSITPPSSTQVTFTFKKGTLVAKGTFGFPLKVKVGRVRFLGVAAAPHSVTVNGHAAKKGSFSFDKASGILDVTVQLPFTSGFTVQYS